MYNFFLLTTFTASIQLEVHNTYCTGVETTPYVTSISKKIIWLENGASLRTAVSNLCGYGYYRYYD